MIVIVVMKRGRLSMTQFAGKSDKGSKGVEI